MPLGWEDHQTKVQASRVFRVAMLGPRRSGKSSVLAVMYDRLQNGGILSKAGMKLCSANEYTEKQLPRRYLELSNIRREGSAGYLPTLVGDTLEHLYQFKLTSIRREDADSALRLEFRDYPGGWIDSEAVDLDARTNYSKVIQYVAESHACVLAIDTPYLMEENMRHHAYRNVPLQIERVLRTVYERRQEKHLLVLVPVRCEKYSRSAQDREIIRQRVLQGYAELLNFCRTHLRDVVRIVICPVETTGSLIFSGFRPNSQDPLLPQPLFYLRDREAVFCPQYSDQPLRHLLHMAVHRHLGALESGFWGWFDGLFSNNKDLQDAIQRFSDGAKDGEGFGVIQSGGV